MPKREIADLNALRALVTQEVAISDWLEMTQERIDAFAGATNDHQWIHVDPERCRRESPFGSTIAHGFLTLSMIPYFTYESIVIREAFAMTINYGLNRVRFMNPVPSGSRIRSRHSLLQLDDVAGGVQATWRVTIEIEGQSKPACVAETVTRFYRDHLKKP